MKPFNFGSRFLWVSFLMVGVSPLATAADNPLGTEAPPLTAPAPDSMTPPAAEPEAAPAPEEVVTTPKVQAPETAPPPVEASSAKTETHFDLDPVPEYQQARPIMGFQVSVSPRSLSKGDLVAGEPGSSARMMALDFDIQPPWTQAFGILGLGVQAAIYSPQATGEAFASSKLGLWSAGAHVRYQFRYFREQVLVPVVGYRFDRLSYKLDSSPSRSSQSGAVQYGSTEAGVLLLLSTFEPSNARTLYYEWGITRSYLAAEVIQVPSVSGAPFPKGIQQMVLGLRLEMI